MKSLVQHNACHTEHPVEVVVLLASRFVRQPQNLELPQALIVIGILLETPKVVVRIANYFQGQN